MTHVTCLQCFDAVGWSAGRASGLQKTEQWGAGVVICLEQGAVLHMAQLMALPLTVSYTHTFNGPFSGSQFFTGWMPFLPPNQQRQSTEGTVSYYSKIQIGFYLSGTGPPG